MEFELGTREREIQSFTCEFAATEVLPRAAEIDRKGKFPMDIVKRMGKHKLFGIPFPVEYGGLGDNLMCYVLMVEELSKVSAKIKK